MSADALQSLFGSGCRAAAVQALAEGWTGTVSELARRTGFSVRSCADEVRTLHRLGLVRLEQVGNADVVRASGTATFKALSTFVLAAGREPKEAPEADRVRESLAALGAPLHGVAPVLRFSPHEAVVRALQLARTDATVLRVLPLVVARQEHALDWAALTELARRQKLKAELGLVVDLAGKASGRPGLCQRVAGMKDRRRTAKRFYPEPKSSFEKTLATREASPEGKAWGFLFPVSLSSVRSFMEKHGAA